MWPLLVRLLWSTPHWLVSLQPREQVAKLTLTPQYEVRPLADRATMIMEMPEYGARYELAVPMLSLIDLPNGKIFDLDGTDLQITLEAVSLGADDLAGTHDDGQLGWLRFI